MASRNCNFIAAAMFVLASCGLSLTAAAHHGWSWTQSGFFKLEGVISALYIGNPHATLEITADGEVWHVDLAPPSRTVRAGFTEDTAAIGDEVVAIGNRSRDNTEKRMKAIRVIVRGKTYDVYPSRAGEI